MQGKESTNGDGKDAAARLMKLKGLDESDAEFARRLTVTDRRPVTSQHIHNWASGTHGLSLDTAMRIAPKLTDAEIVFVVAGRDLDSPESLDAAYVQGLREAFASARAAIDAAEEDATESAELPAPSARPATKGEKKKGIQHQQPSEAARKAKKKRKDRKRQQEGGG